MDSENLSSLIRLSVSDGQKTDRSKVVSVIGRLYIKNRIHHWCSVGTEKSLLEGPRFEWEMRLAEADLTWVKTTEIPIWCVRNMIVNIEQVFLY